MKVTQVLAALALIWLVGCSSQAPKTKYYSLFADEAAINGVVRVNQDDISIGIGPIVLPEFLEHSAIVSVSDKHQVRVSGHHAWAGDLDTAMARVLADSISTQLDLNNVWAFPWDARVRPRYQVRIVVEDFSGELGQQVTLKAKWSLVDQTEGILLSTGKGVLRESTASASFDDYVVTMNNLINAFSRDLLVDVLAEVSPQAIPSNVATPLPLHTPAPVTSLDKLPIKDASSVSF